VADKALGARLKAAGLTPRALAAWAGTDRLSTIAARHDELSGKRVTVSSAALAANVAGAQTAYAVTLPGWAVLPLGPSLLVCDRMDTLQSEYRVCFPDDSSYHLALSIPAGRRARWLDLGCGSAFAPLLRPELAAQIDCVDLNPRAVECAVQGAALSGIEHLRAHHADLAEAPAGPYDLVTCNAPMPGSTDAAIWRSADDKLFARLWRTAATRVGPDGMVIVHGDLAELRKAPASGERIIVAYTPRGAARGFGVLWWRPDAEARLVEARRDLTGNRPHLDATDRDDALL
jgi:SAM-dependent methyltransferase